MGTIEKMERETIPKALYRAKGDRTIASSLLGVSMSTLYRKMLKYNIDCTQKTTQETKITIKMKKQLFTLVLLVITSMSYAQCFKTFTCDTDSITFNYDASPKHGDVDTIELTINSVVHAIKVARSDSFSLTFPASGLSCTDTITKIRYFKNGGPIGHTCNAHTTLPVELISFIVKIEDRLNVLYWTTASELNNSGFEVYKSYDGEHWEFSGFVTGNGTTTEYKSYEFFDTEITSCYYQLKQVDYDGEFDYSNIIRASRESREIVSVRIYTLQGVETNYKDPGSIIIIEYSDKTVEKRIIR